MDGKEPLQLLGALTLKDEVHAPGGGLALWLKFRNPALASPWIDAMRIRGLVLNHPEHYFLADPGPFTRRGQVQCP